MTDYKNLKLIASSSPHIRSKDNTRSIRRVAFCILVDLPCTVKAHFAGIVVFEPCVHVARIYQDLRLGQYRIRGSKPHGFIK